MAAQQVSKNPPPEPLVSRKPVAKTDDLNLLPPEQKNNESVVKLARVLKAVSTVGIVLFLIAILSAIAFAFYNANELKTLEQDRSQLENQVKLLESTEQSFIVMRDRLDKIADIYSLPSTLDDVDNLQVMISNFPENAVLESVSIEDNDTTSIRLFIPSSSELVELFEFLKTVPLYQSVVIKSLVIREGGGYLINLVFS